MSICINEIINLSQNFTSYFWKSPSSLFIFYQVFISSACITFKALPHEDEFSIETNLREISLNLAAFCTQHIFPLLILPSFMFYAPSVSPLSFHRLTICSQSGMTCVALPLYRPHFNWSKVTSRRHTYYTVYCRSSWEGRKYRRALETPHLPHPIALSCIMNVTVHSYHSSHCLPELFLYNNVATVS